MLSISGSFCGKNHRRYFVFFFGQFSYVFGSLMTHFHAMKSSIENPLIFSLIFSLHVASLFPSLKAMKITIITVILEDNRSYGSAIQGPALDVAYQEAIKSFPQTLKNATRITISKPGILSCGDATELTPLVAAEIDQVIRRVAGFAVVIITGCSAEALVLGDFGREWNIPVVSTIGNDVLLGNKKRYPTLLAFGLGSWIQAIVKLLEHFRWTTISLLCDTLSTRPASIALYAALTCKNLMASLDRNVYTVYDQKMDSLEDKRASDLIYENVLKSSAEKSRVIVLASDLRSIRRIMIMAHRLNMTNGDYVYIAPVSTKVPYAGDMTWEYFDEDDQIARLAYQSLIFSNNPNANWAQMRHLIQQMSNLSETVYNYTLTQETYLNDLAFVAYETMTCIAMALDAVLISGSESRLDTVTFLNAFQHRTFPVPSRSITIGSDGMRITDLILSRLNTSTGKMEPAWQYYTATDFMGEISELAHFWPNCSGPPSDRPVCGFHGELCMPKDDVLKSPLAIALLALLGILLSVVTWVAVVAARRKRVLDSTWWILDDGSLISESADLLRDTIDVGKFNILQKWRD